MTDMSGFEFDIPCVIWGHGISPVHGGNDEYATHLLWFDCDNCIFIGEGWCCTTYVESLYDFGIVQCPSCGFDMAVEGCVSIVGTVGV